MIPPEANAAFVASMEDVLARIIHRMPGIRWRMSHKVLIALMDWVSTPSIHARTLRHIRHVREY